MMSESSLMGKNEKLIESVKKVALMIEKSDIDEYEIYASKLVDKEIEVFNESVESLSHSDSNGIGIRVFKDKRVGYAWTNSFDENKILDCIEKAILNAKITKADELNGLPHTYESKYSSNNADILKNLFDESFFDISIEEKIERTKNLERIAKKKDKRISGVDSLNYSDAFSEVAIFNSNGFEGEYKETNSFIFLSVIARDGEDTSTGFSFDYKRSLKNFDFEVVADEAVKKSTILLGAKKIKSIVSKVLLDPIIASQFLGIIASILTADSVQKGKSLFKDKINQKIFSLDLNIFDDGLLKNGFASKPFDAEGVAKGRTQVFKDGILKTFLYDTYTARKDKTLSTGNAVRASYMSMPSVGISNFYIEPSNKSFKEILKSIDEGFYIIDVIGLHSGANPISGEISVGAKGIWIKNGSLEYPVKEVTIATDILSFCKEILMIGKDIRFFPSFGYIGSPSILLNNITIGGT